jgi:hypothetical protein
VWPLSLLALHAASVHLSIPRDQIRFEDYVKDKEQLDKQRSSLEEASLVCQDVITVLNHPRLHYVFTKHVKTKKQHEISKMAQV